MVANAALNARGYVFLTSHLKTTAALRTHPKLYMAQLEPKGVHCLYFRALKFAAQDVHIYIEREREIDR